MRLSGGASKPDILSRRNFIVGATVAGAGALGANTAFGQRAEAPPGPTPIVVAATPIAQFMPGMPDRRVFGDLTFRSGLALRSSFSGFGGFSGLSRNADGKLVALNDASTWLTAKLVTRAGLLVGLDEAVMAPILAASGRPLRRTRSYDTEGLSMAGGTAYVAIERTQEVMAFDFAREGVLARARPVAVPRAAKALPSNSGLEAIGVAPPRHPLAGALIAIAERVDDGADSPTLGFILSGQSRGTFEVARSERFDITDLAFLPTGDLLLLERRFSLLGGLAVRMRRVPGKSLAPGARLDGRVVFEASGGAEIDNFEGLALHQEESATIVTLISDDNFSMLQRTLLLEFTLAA